MSTSNRSMVPSLSISTAWERPLVPFSGGKTHLLVTIKATPAGGSAPTRRAPLDLAFVLDRSGSMSGEPLRLVKEAVTQAITHLRDEDRMALVVYDNDVDLLHTLEGATSRVKAAVRLALHGVDTRGSTNLSGGWLRGCDQLSQDLGTRNDVRIRRALLLTDGLANAGITDAGQLAEHAGQLRRRGIGTTTLGVGDGFDEELLVGMAEAGGGNFQYIQRPEELRAFFERELGELLTIAAAGLSLSITLPPGVRARLINAFPSTRTGKRIDVALGDLPANDEVTLVFGVSARPGTLGTEHTVALAATWADPAADAKRSLEISLPTLRLADPTEVVATTADADVAEIAALERAREAQREAMKLDRAGRHAESRQQMAGAVRFLAMAPPTASVQRESAAYALLAEADATTGWDEHTRKQSAYESHRRSRGKREE